MIAYRSNPLPPSFVGKILSSNLSAMGTPHHTAGRIDERRRAKSHGCHGLGTFRTTARRGWRSVGFGVAAPPLLGLEEEDVAFEGSESLAEMTFVGVDNARLWVGGRVMTRWP